MDIKALADKYNDYIIERRRYYHTCPELSNEEKETPYEGFAYEAIVPVEGDITLPTQTDIQNLFRMTPYAWKTPRSGKERLAALNTLTTRIAFRVHVFRRDDKKGDL